MARRYRKIVMVLTIFTSIITVVSVSWKFLMGLYFQYKFNINTGDASSVGIIGGADGPTSIFLSGSPYSRLITVIFGILSMLGITYLVVTSKAKNHK
mgnify:CR=1 FL=1